MICVWLLDVGGFFLMSGVFCFDGGSGVIRWNSNMENKIRWCYLVKSKIDYKDYYVKYKNFMKIWCKFYY